MSRRLALLLCLALTGCGGPQPAPAPAPTAPAQPAPNIALPRELRVCADPNNLPFSNERREGFENRIVELAAADLHLPVRWIWRAQRRGFVREGLRGRQCDIVSGTATAVDMLATTRPYYRSTYVWVSRADRHITLSSFDDPALRRLTIGVQMVGDDGANTPPAHSLARRGIVANVRGYSLYGDYARPNPPIAILDAVVNREIDVAAVWGPLAGWYARRSFTPLRLTPVQPWLDGPQWPMIYDVSMGLRREDVGLRRALDGALDRHRTEIDRILADSGVPGPEPDGTTAN